MSAPYPVDPTKTGPPVAGWGVPGSAPPYPTQQAPPYPTQQAPPYATQPTSPYPTQPPPPYSAQPGFAPQPGYAPQPGFAGQPGAYVVVAAYPSSQPGHAVPSGQRTGGGRGGGQEQTPTVYFLKNNNPLRQQHQAAHLSLSNQPMPILNASGGGCPIQPGPGAMGAAPGMPKDDTEVLPDHFGASFSDKAIRHAFIRKVYLILMVQLLVTLGIVSLFTFHSGVRNFVQRNIAVYLLSYAVFVVTYLTMVCCSSVRRKWPGNFIMLGIFTLALSYMAGAIASRHDTQIVIMTVGITAAICLLITLFATQTKYDFTGCGIYLFVATMILFIFGIIAIFTYSKILYTLYSAGIALLFSMYLIFDTQMIVGGRKHEMSPEEHIYGALVLYLDVINIFLALLSIFGGRD